ncbi:MAG: mechanosensitive ion channel family protein [Deltaproteobacteria bacterium]|nr:mechanosensitive ion channel family protein [Deltaproteobacteria bacterium]
MHTWAAENLPLWFNDRVIGVAIWQIFGIFALIFIALLLQRLVVFFISSYFKRLVGRVAPSLEDSVQRAAQPLSGLTMALVFGVGFPLLGFGSTVEGVVRLAVRILAVASGVWLVYRQIDVISRVLADRAERTETKLDDQLVPLVRRTLKSFTMAIGGIFVLQNLDVDVASLVAGLGLGGLAFALAAKDTLANFFGSLVIFIDRPFQIGDWVIIGNIEGTVADVGFRTTRIRTFYDSLVTVPNSQLTAKSIDNMGAREHRRIKMMLGLTYSTTPPQMQAFVEGLRAIITAHPLTRKDTYEIHFNQFGAYALEVLFYVFVTVPSWSEELKARHELMLSILELAQRVGVEFAFPTSTIQVDAFYGDTPRVVGGGKAPGARALQETVEGFGPGGALANPRFDLTHGYYPGQPSGRGEGEG